MKTDNNELATEFLRSKIKSLRTNQITHYNVCERRLKRHRYTGIILVIISTVSLGATFIDVEKAPWMSWIIPVLAIAVALLSAVLTFMSDQPQAMDHQSSAVAYGAILGFVA